MTKRILDVGNCAPDFASISNFLTTQFDCQVDQTHGPQDTLDMLRQGDYALVLVNRTVSSTKTTPTASRSSRRSRPTPICKACR